MDIRTTLESYGLSSNETKIYLAGLKLGNSRIHDLAKEAGILRTTCYEVIKSLTDKGLASSVIKSGITYVDIADPKLLIQRLEDKKRNLQKIIPDLENLQKISIKKPVVEMYEGKEGLKTILNDVIKVKKDFLACNNYELFKVLNIAMPQFIQKRIQHKIPAKVIQERNKHMLDVKKADKKEYRHIKFFPKKLITDTLIYGNNVAFMTLKGEQLLGVVIRNKHIADNQRIIFDQLWKIAED